MFILILKWIYLKIKSNLYLNIIDYLCYLNKKLGKNRVLIEE